MPDSRLGRTLREALRPALRTVWWLIRLMWPITLAIACLDYLGVIAVVSAWMAPLFEAFGLPGHSSLVFVTAALSNLYAVVAVMATLGFDYRSVMILSVMALICHNLIIESAIQQKTGTPAWAMALLRIAMALVAAWCLHGVLPAGLSGKLLLPAADQAPSSWGEVLTGCLRTLGPLTLRMGLIVIGLNLLQAILREYRVTDRLAGVLRPLMALLGLPASTSLLWIIGNVVGLAYGGAALIDELRRGEVSRADARLLNTHLAVSHSLLEDTSIFVSVGVGLFWLMIPRLLLALGAVWLLRGFLWIKSLPFFKTAVQTGG